MISNTTVLTLDELAGHSVKRNPSNLKSNILLEVIAIVMAVLFLVIGYVAEDRILFRVAGYIVGAAAIIDFPFILMNIRNHNLDYIRGRFLKASLDFEGGITYIYTFEEEKIHIKHILGTMEGETDLNKDCIQNIIKEENIVYIYISRAQFYILKLDNNTPSEQQEIFEILSKMNRK